MRPTISLEKICALLERVYLSRYADEKMSKLVRQNKGGTFQLSSAGHELVGVLAAQALLPGKDWAFPYYRDQGFAIGLGCDLAELFGVFLGRATPHHSGGRMMPYHYSHKPLRICCQSSVVGSQFLQAVGRGRAIQNLGSEEVVYVSAGDGATSQGDFHEALNFATLYKLPVIFVIQNNGWAISVPLEEQRAGGTLEGLGAGYHGLHVHHVAGTSYPELEHTFEKAVTRARLREGPSLVIAEVPRLQAHSSSDDPKKYKSAEALAEEEAQDPILHLEQWATEHLALPYETCVALRARAQAQVEEAAQKAEGMPYPDPGSGRLRVFASFTPPLPLTPSPLASEEEKIVIMDALNHALDEEMAHDSHVVVFGQDVARGKGGVFGVTKHLTEKYGPRRCFNTPLAESTIIGVAIGMAFDGIHKPVVEIQFADYIWTGINQLFNEAASIYYRSDGVWEMPLVVRMPCGGYIQGGPYHSQSIEGFLAHCPGLKVVIPSNAADAKGLLKTAIRDPNPVLFLEHKALYRQQKFCARAEPSKDHLIPFGQAAVVRSGKDITVIGWGMMVPMAWDIAEKLAQEGIDIEILDLRTLVPLDMATILASVSKTGKVLVAHEGPGSGGFGAEIAARIAEQAFSSLDAPVFRVTGFEAPVPYSKPLENEVLPQPADLERGIRYLLRY